MLSFSELNNLYAQLLKMILREMTDAPQLSIDAGHASKVVYDVMMRS